MDSVEKKIFFPDKSIVRYYVDKDTGLQTLNMEDVMKVMQGSDENKKILASKMGEFSISTLVSAPLPKKSPNPKKLSDFNQKLKQAGDYNPNKNKK